MSKKIQLNLKEFPTVEINDLGSELNKQFQELYYYFLSFNKIVLSGKFKSKSVKFFNQLNKANRSELSNKYFGNFTIITERLILQTQFHRALLLWYDIIYFVRKWEQKSGKLLHKGTSFYFAAVAAIYKRDFDTAFILMRLANKEDKNNESNYLKTPSHYFLTLNNGSPSYLKKFIEYMINFLKDRLDGSGNQRGKYKEHYQRARSGLLTYEQLQLKFLDNVGIADEVRFYFVYSIIKLWHLRILQKNKMGDDIMAPVIFIQSLGGLLITIEQLLKDKFSAQNFGEAFIFLARDERWDNNLKLKQINKELGADFEAWINKYLSENTLFADFKLAYRLRNFAFHNIKSQKYLWERYTEILQSILNCLFKAIEIQ